MHDERVGPLSAAHREYLADIVRSGQGLLLYIDSLLDVADEDGVHQCGDVDLVALLAAFYDDVAGPTSAGGPRIVLTSDADVRARWGFPDVGADGDPERAAPAHSPCVVRVNEGRLRRTLHLLAAHLLALAPTSAPVAIDVDLSSASQPPSLRLHLRRHASGVAEPDDDEVAEIQLPSGVIRLDAIEPLAVALARALVATLDGHLYAQAEPGLVDYVVELPLAERASATRKEG